MAIELGAAYISILPETSKLAAGIKTSMNDAERQAGVTGEKMGKNMGGGFMKHWKKIAAGAAVVGTGIGVIGKQTIGMASDAEQSVGATEAIFGKFADRVVKRSKEVGATKWGLDENQVREQQNLLGSLLKNQGVAMKDLAGTTEKHLTLGADLSAMYGGSTSDAVDAMTAAYKGEYNQLERYGIVLNQTMVNEEMKARGLDKLTGAQKRQAEQQVKQDLIMKQSADAQGTFQKESKTFAGQMQRLGAEVRNMGIQVGTKLLPVALKMVQLFREKAIPVIKDFGGWLKDNVLPVLQTFGNWLKNTVVPALKDFGTWLKNNSDYLVAIAAGVGAALIALGAYNAYVKITTAVTKAWAFVQKVLNGSLKANPIGIVVTVLALLVGALVLAYKKSDTFRRIVDAAWAGIKRAIGAAWAFIKPIFSAIVNFIVNNLGPVIKAWFNNIVKPYFALVGKIISAAWNNVIKPVFKALANFITDTVVPAFRKGVNKIGDIWDGLKSAARKPVEFLVNTVYNDGIRKMMNYIPGVSLPSASFARGGVMPGYTPGRDVHTFFSPTAGRLNLSGGEAIMRPEFTRAVGGAKGVARLNALARKGLSFFAGGVLPLPGGSVSTHGSGYSGYAADLNYPGYADYGKPVKAWKSGSVAQMNYIGDRSYGRWVVLNHGSQSSLYAHLSGFAGGMGIGSKVGAGQTIGYVGDIGNTGNPPTSHLHFEINGGSVSAGTANYGGPTPEQQAKAKWTDVLTKVPEAAKNVWKNIQSMGGSEWFTTMKSAATAVFKDAVGWIDNKIPNKFLPDTPVASALKKFGIFDNGGILQPGGLAYNASSKPEAVFNHKQFKAYATQGGGSRNAFPRKVTLVVGENEFDAYVRDTARDEFGAEATYNNNRWRAYN